MNTPLPESIKTVAREARPSLHTLETREMLVKIYTEAVNIESTLQARDPSIVALMREMVAKLHAQDTRIHELTREMHRMKLGMRLLHKRRLRREWGL